MISTVVYRGQRYGVQHAVDRSDPDHPIFATSLIEAPGCTAQGATLAEAEQRLEELVRPYFELLERHGVATPQPQVPVVVIAAEFHDAPPPQIQPGQFARPPELAFAGS